MIDTTPYIERELTHKKRKLFLLIYPLTEEIWIDTKGLPQTAILCAMCDGTPMRSAKVGSKKQFERYFLPIEWAIDDWGGDPKLVEALKKRRKIEQDDMAQHHRNLALEELTKQAQDLKMGY